MAVVNLDTAARLDIICRRGDSFSLAVEFDSDISDQNSSSDAIEGGADDVWTMTIRTAVDADTAELSGTDQAMTVEVDENDDKKLNITNSAANMALLDAGLYVYDVQRSTGSADAGEGQDAIVGDITTYLFGTFEVRADVSEGTE